MRHYTELTRKCVIFLSVTVNLYITKIEVILFIHEECRGYVVKTLALSSRDACFEPVYRDNQPLLTSSLSLTYPDKCFYNTFITFDDTQLIHRAKWLKWQRF
jgi:hypothetical protein